jgi:hypothetical protein
MKKKLIIFCIAVGLSLTLAATSFAGPTLDLNADSLTPGLYDPPNLGPLTISTALGPVTFQGEVKLGAGGDAEFQAAGASGLLSTTGLNCPGKTSRSAPRRSFMEAIGEILQ